MAQKALLIEDNENNRYLLRLLLEHAGFTVVSAEEGRSGLDLARNETPDVIPPDIQMPDMDGYEVAAAPDCGRQFLRHVGRPRSCHAGGLRRIYREARRPGAVRRIGDRIPERCKASR